MGLRKLFAAAASAATAALGACEEGPAVVSNYDRGPLVWSVLVDASKNGPMLARVHGNPFSLPDADLAALIHERMAKAIGERKIRYTSDPGEAPRPGARVAIVFGAPKDMNGDRFCQGRAPELAPEPERITVRALFCSEENLLSDAQGWVKDVAEPTDKRFAILISSLTHTLLAEPER